MHVLTRADDSRIRRSGQPGDAMTGAVRHHRSPMRWSWKIADVAGIPVRIHVTFLLFLVWLFWAGASHGAGLWRAAQGVLFILAAFGCVVLHEFGNALT